MPSENSPDERTRLLSSQSQSVDGNDLEQPQQSGSKIRKNDHYLVEVTHSQVAALMACIFLTWFIGSFDGSIMASSHPVISSYFGASTEATWFSTSFLLTSCSFSSIFARISDTFGRRVPLLVALSAFALGTLWCALAPTLLHFILARAFCGLGAGAALTQTVTLISDLLPLRKRGAFISWVNLAYGIGSSLGVALGGVFAETIGWRWEFGMQVPFIIMIILIVYVTLPSNLGPQLAQKNPQPIVQLLKRFDILGGFLLTSTSTFIIILLSFGGNTLPWTHPLIPSIAAAALISGLALYHVEKRAAQPIIPLHLLFRAPQGNIVFSNFLACMTINTMFFNSPLFFQAVLLDSPSKSGIRLIPPFAIGMISAFSSGHIITWTGQLKSLIISGLLFILLGSVLLSIMNEAYPQAFYSSAVTLPMIGQGFAFPTFIVAQLAVSPPEEVAIATATLLLFKNLGSIAGIALSGLVLQNTLQYYLQEFVQGPDRIAIIEKVRQAAGIVRELPLEYQSQVVKAYVNAMHWTFWQGAITVALGLGLILVLKLPNLGAK